MPFTKKQKRAAGLARAVQKGDVPVSHVKKSIRQLAKQPTSVVRDLAKGDIVKQKMSQAESASKSRGMK